MSDNLIILKNSSYAKGRKYIVDAEQINQNNRAILESVGSTSIKSIIESTGQIYNPLQSDQLLNSIVQLIVAANYFKDTGTVNNIILEPYTAGYGTPIAYVQNMVIKFRPSTQNTGPTLISFKGMSSVPLLTDTYVSLPSGSLSANSDFTAVYDESRNAFILSSTVEDSGSLALQEIRRVIESAGIMYSESIDRQLLQAISLYSLQSTYKNTSTGANIISNNYILEPYSSFQQIPGYTDGMVIRFRPVFANTLINPTIQIGNLQKVPFLSSNGDNIAVGALSVNFDVVVRYLNGAFYLVSNGMSSLRLQNGNYVTGISNDPSLTASSSTNLVTENAVKVYVDSRVQDGNQYVVVSGKTGIDGRSAFIDKTTDASITVLAGESGKPSYTNLSTLANSEASEAKEPTVDPEDPEETITYSLSNCFDGDNTTYYETKLQGSIVAGIKNAEKEYEYTTMPCFIGSGPLTKTISRVRLLGVDSFSSPSEVFFQYSFDGVNWKNVGTYPDCLYNEVNDSGVVITKCKPTIYQNPVTSGSYTDIDITFKPYIDETDITKGVSSEPYYFRCYASSFTGVEGWKIISFEFCESSDEIKPLVLSYANKLVEVITTKLSCAIPVITDGSYVIIKTYGGGVYALESSLYVESSQTPTNIEANIHWVKPLNGKIQTFIGESEDDGSVSLREANFIKVGYVEVLGGKITKAVSSAFGTKYTKDNITLVNPVVVEHNMGSLSKAESYIVCTSADLGYSIGDSIRLSNQYIMIDSSGLTGNTSIDSTNLSIGSHTIADVEYSHTITPNPHTHTATTTVSGKIKPSYITVSCGLNEARIMYSAIVLPNKNTGELQPITESRWKVSITCERNF